MTCVHLIRFCRGACPGTEARTPIKFDNSIVSLGSQDREQSAQDAMVGETNGERSVCASKLLIRRLRQPCKNAVKVFFSLPSRRSG